MQDLKNKLEKFLQKPIGLVLLFVVLFYVITFAVYYFYSPGPEERKQAERNENQTQAEGAGITQEIPS